MVVDVGTHLDFFYVLSLLRLARRIGFFLGFVFELADVEKLSHGRFRVGRNLNQIKARTGGLLDGIFGTQNAQILALVVNHAYRAGLNELVEAGAVFRRRRRPPAGGWRTYSSVSFKCFSTVK